MSSGGDDRGSRLREVVRLFSSGQDRAARDLINEIAYPLEGPPSPVAQMVEESTDTGEWNGNVEVGLFLINGESCGARVGKGGGDGEEVTDRICSRHISMCTALSHQGKSLVPKSHYGWYIGYGGSSVPCVLQRPFLTVGPGSNCIFDERASRRLSSMSNPFKMKGKLWLIFMIMCLEEEVSPSDEEDSPFVDPPNDESSSGGSTVAAHNVDNDASFDDIKSAYVPPAKEAKHFRFEAKATEQKDEEMFMEKQAEPAVETDVHPVTQVDVRRWIRDAVQRRSKEMQSAVDARVEGISGFAHRVSASVNEAWESIRENQVKNDTAFVGVDRSILSLSAKLTALEDLTDQAIARSKLSKQIAEDSSGCLANLHEKMASGGGVRFHDVSFDSCDELSTFCQVHGIVKGSLAMRLFCSTMVGHL